MTNYIQDPNGIFHVSSSGDVTSNDSFTADGVTWLRDPGGNLHLPANSPSDFINDGSETLNSKSINSDGGKFTTDGSGKATVSGLELGSFNISENTDPTNNVGYLLTSSDSFHVDIFGGKLASSSTFDFSDKNIRSFYTWPSAPSGQFIFGFSTQNSTSDSLIITEATTSFNNNIAVTGTTSLDNTKITTDGSGNLTVGGNLDLGGGQITSDANGNLVIWNKPGIGTGTGASSIGFMTHSPDTNNSSVNMFWQENDTTDELGNKITGGRFHFSNLKYGNTYEFNGTIVSGAVVANNGATGTFTSNDGKTVTITSGIITSIA